MKLNLEIVPNASLPEGVLSKLEAKARLLGFEPEEFIARILTREVEPEQTAPPPQARPQAA